VPRRGPIATTLAALDPFSRLRLRIFAFKLLTIIPVSVALARPPDYPLLVTISIFCLWHCVFCGIAALFRKREPPVALTAWDETAAFLAIAIVMHRLAAIMA
jgi:hypothetical protein